MLTIFRFRVGGGAGGGGVLRTIVLCTTTICIIYSLAPVAHETFEDTTL